MRSGCAHSLCLSAVLVSRIQRKKKIGYSRMMIMHEHYNEAINSQNDVRDSLTFIICVPSFSCVHIFFFSRSGMKN